MLLFDYSLEPTSSRKLAAVDLAHAAPEELRYELFLGNVYLRESMEQIDFSAPWGWVPVLDFALSLKAVSEALEEDTNAKFEFTESDAVLSFERLGVDVEITASYAAGSIRLSHAQFGALAAAFSRRVVNELCTQNLQLAANPEIRRHL
ncbi:MAG: hypothetical protein SGI86_21370 [Deltaproteobacteria bacterium]|nr:hypothetical protein [Deltaproteobacteria bacterium]